MRRIGPALVLSTALALAACVPGESAPDSEPRIIKIQIEGCKEQSPTPTAFAAAPTSTPPAVAGTGGDLATAASSPAADPASSPTALAGAPTPSGADTTYFRRVGDVKTMLAEKHFSRLDIPGVDDAMRRADEESAAGHYDEAMRQLGVAETLLRTRKVDMGILNTKLERLSKSVEKLRTASPGDFTQLNRQLQDANTALIVGQYPKARDILWRIDGELDQIAMRGMPKR